MFESECECHYAITCSWTINNRNDKYNVGNDNVGAVALFMVSG